jgi:hypothetical protein
MAAYFVGGLRRHMPDGKAVGEIFRAPRSPAYEAGTGYYRSPAVWRPKEPRDGTIELV